MIEGFVFVVLLLADDLFASMSLVMRASAVVLVVGNVHGVVLLIIGG